MGKPAVLSIRIVTDGKEGKKGLDDVAQSITGLESKVTKASGPLGKIGNVVAGVGKFAATATVAVAALAAGVVALAIKGGIDRALAIEGAQAKLKGLGNDTKTVTAVMDSALASVKGTAFGLGDAATVAANVVAAGVKPGQDLTRTLKLVADAATIAGIPLNEMGSIFNKVAAGGKVTTEVINQLQDRGVPAFALLAKAMGKTVPEIQAMVTAGKVSFADFQNAMEQGVGGAALKSGDTTVGAFKNMQAALSRWGESLISGVFPLAKTAFGGITTFVDELASKSKPFITEFSAGVAGFLTPALANFTAFLQGAVLPALLGFAGFVKDSVIPAVVSMADWVGTYLVPALAYLGQTVGGALWDAIVRFGAWFAQNQGSIGSFGATLGGIVSAGLRVFADTLKTVIDVGAAVTAWVMENKDWLLTLGAAVLGGVVAFKAMNAAMAAYSAVMTTVKTVQTAFTTAIAAYRAGLSIATAVQAGFNVALAANPIGLAVIAIAALAAGIIWAYNNVGWFKDVVDLAFKGIQIIIGAVVQWFIDRWNGAVALGVLAVQAWQLTFQAILQTIQAVIGAVVQWFVDRWNGAVALGVLAVQAWQLTFQTILRTVQAVIGAVVQWFKDRWDDAISFGVGVVRGFQDTVGNVFRTVQDAINTVIGWVRDRLGDAFNFASDVARRAFGAVIDTIKGVIGWVRDAISWVGSLFGATDQVSKAGASLARGATAVYSFAASAVPSVGAGVFSAPAGLGDLSIGATSFLSSTGRAPSRPLIASGPTINMEFNITGAMDPAAVSRQIRALVIDGLRSEGVLANGERPW